MDQKHCEEEELKEIDLRPTYDSLMAKQEQLSDILEFELGLHSKRGLVPDSTRFYSAPEKIYSIISIQNHPSSVTITKIEKHPHNQCIRISWLFDVYFDENNLKEEWKIACVCGHAILSRIVIVGMYKYFIHYGCEAAPSNNHNKPKSALRHRLPIYNTNKVAIMTQDIFVKCGAKIKFGAVIEHLKQRQKLNGENKYININDGKIAKQKEKSLKKNNKKKLLSGRKRKKAMSSDDDKEQNLIKKENEPKYKKAKSSIDYFNEIIQYYDFVDSGANGAVSLVYVKGKGLGALKATTKAGEVENEVKYIKMFQSKYVVELIEIVWFGTRLSSFVANDWSGFIMEYGDSKMPAFRERIAANADHIRSCTDQLLHNVLSAILEVHSHGYLVIDVKMSNLIIQNGIIKLIDFGGTVKNGGPVRQYTKSKAPPEFISHKLLNGSTATFIAAVEWDMWCVGLIAFEFASGSSLFHEKILQKLHFKQYQTMTNAELFDNIPMDQSTKAVVKKLLSYKPDDRYKSCQSVLNEPCFAAYGILDLSIDDQFRNAGYTVPQIDITKFAPQTLSDHHNPFLQKKKRG